MTTSYEYALVPVSETHAARLPLPIGQTDAERAAYLANPPEDVLAAAELWPLPPKPAAPAVPDESHSAAPDASEED